MMLIQHHTAREYYDRAHRPVRAAATKTRANRRRVMALVVHPYIMGAPHRLK